MSTKGFRDSIHGFIDLDPLLVKVIDTPQLQRLRNIKQLGGNYHVYPGACHNRFEHSIGTCYLAGKLARHLQDEQRKEGMKDIKEEMENAMEEIKEKVKGDTMKDMKKKMEKTTKYIKKVLKGIDDIEKTVENKMKDITEGLKEDTMKDVKEVIENAMKDIKEFLKEKTKNDIEKTVENVVKEFKEMMENTRKNIKEEMEGNTMKDIKKKMENLMKDIKGVLKEGILKDIKKTVENEIKEMVKNTMTTANQKVTIQRMNKFIEDITNKMEENKKMFITDKDILCVELAGLCHDLGHGPFSHVFDGQFMNKFSDKDKRSWKHEQGSRKMLDRLIEKNGEVKEIFEGYLKDVKEFIKEMIDPPGNAKDYKERPNKPFLYEIISNKENEVDVDKWDYFARDCHHLGQKSTFDHNRYISLTKVLKCAGEDKQHIAVRDKERRNLYEMFHVRDYLHKSVYQHDVTKAVEEMIADALFLADKHVTFKGTNEEGELGEFTISETVKNMEAYELLNDSVLDMVLYQNAEEGSDLEKAQNILKRIHARDFYRRFGHDKSFSSDQKDLCERAKEKFEEICKQKKEKNDDLDCFVILKKFNFGFKDQDPVKKCWFFTKESPKAAKKLDDDVSKMLPKIFQEFQLVVYNKTSKKDLNDGLKNEETELLEELETAWKNLEKKYKEKEFSETFLNAWNKLEGEDKENGFLNELKNAWEKLEKEGEQKELPKFLQTKLENFEKKDKKIKLLKDLKAEWEKLKKENKQQKFPEYVREVWKKLDKEGAEKKFPKYLQAAWEKLKKKDKQLFEDLRDKVSKAGGENELSEYFQEELEKLEN